jgi:hypothetical protein
VGWPGRRIPPASAEKPSLAVIGPNEIGRTWVGIVSGSEAGLFKSDHTLLVRNRGLELTGLEDLLWHRRLVQDRGQRCGVISRRMHGSCRCEGPGGGNQSMKPRLVSRKAFQCEGPWKTVGVIGLQ